MLWCPYCFSQLPVHALFFDWTLRSLGSTINPLVQLLSSGILCETIQLSSLHYCKLPLFSPWTLHNSRASVVHSLKQLLLAWRCLYGWSLRCFNEKTSVAISKAADKNHSNHNCLQATVFVQFIKAWLWPRWRVPSDAGCRQTLLSLEACSRV